MNQFYLAVELLRNRLSANYDVNTTLFGRTEDKDLYKKNIYPIAHIVPVSAESTSRVSTFTFDVAALDQRDLSKQEITDKFLSNDDLQDNLNVTYSILNDLVSWLQRQNNDQNIELSAVGTFQPVLFKDYNLLDGWVVQITLQVPNNIDVC
jgi:hypothetical protein